MKPISVIFSDDVLPSQSLACIPLRDRLLLDHKRHMPYSIVVCYS